MSKPKAFINYSNVDIFENYIFDIGKPINPIDASRKLLEAEVGQAFRNYQTGKSELSDNYAIALNEHKKVIKMKEVLEELDKKPNLGTYLKLIKQDPAYFLKAFGNAFWVSITGKSKSDENEITETELKKHLDEFDKWAGDTITDLLGLLAIHEFVDKEIFSSSYLDGNPFARISLQPFGATIEKQSVLFDVTLTLHRSGVAILTIYHGLSDVLPLEDLQKYQRFNRLKIEDCELPTKVINKYANLIEGYIPRIGYSKKFASDEYGYTKFENGELPDIGEILDAYRFYCIETILGKAHWSIDYLLNNLRSDFWSGYPIIFINKTKPEYISRKDLLKDHSGEIAKLIIGFTSSSDLTPEVISKTCLDDLSIVEDYSLYLTEGSGTIIYYNAQKKNIDLKENGIEDIRKQFHTSAVVDMLLFQRGIMQIFNSQISHAYYDLTKLTKLKQEFIMALQEFEALGISYYGTVHEIIKRGQEIFRINDLRKMFEIKLQGVEGLIQKEEEQNRLRRERIFKMLTTIVAIVFSLPGI